MSILCTFAVHLTWALTLNPNNGCSCNKDCKLGKQYLTVLCLNWGGSPLPYGKATGPAQGEKNDEKWASLLLAIAVSSCESACCRWVSVWQKLCTQDLYGSTISSFTSNHSVWLNSYYYRYISLNTQELYHLMSLIAFGIGQASVIFGQSLIEVIGQYHLGQARYIFGSHWNYYHHSLIGVINCYHHLMNKTYIWRIFNVIG